MKIIELKDIKGNFYGGLPYSVSWDFNGGENPSRLKISVVNEKGVYTTPILSFSKIESIKLNDFNFKGYLVNYNENFTVNQKTLDLEYVDTSIVLEKYFVILHTKHGNKFDIKSLKDTNLIVVGKPYHPCDSNMDSTVAFEESNAQDVDWCDPCPFMPPDKYKETCNPERANFEIFPVFYTFNELINTIRQNRIIEIEIEFDIDKFIKRNYEGSLKNVLSSWCEDLGLSYYFDNVKNKLVFIDRSKPISIPDFSKDSPDLIDLNKSESIENTFSRGYIANYEKVGEYKSYNCENERIITINCVVLQDLYIDGSYSGNDSLYDFDSNLGPATLSNSLESNLGKPHSTPDSSSSSSSGSPSSSSSSSETDASNNKDAKNTADVEELLTAVSYLGEPAHHAFTWFWYYQIKTAQDVINKYLIKDYEEEATPEGQKKVLKYFGNMKIRDVYSADNLDELKRVHFTTCRNKMDPEKRDLLDAECKVRGFTKDNPGYFFIVADFNEEFFDKQVKIRLDRAENFLGKYWYKHFGINFLIAGGDNQNGEINVSNPDNAEAKWFKANESTEGLGIFGFGHTEKSKIGKLFKDIPDTQLEIEKGDKKYWKDLKTFGPEQPDLRKTTSSFILMNRPTKWFPDKSSFIYYESLFKWYSDVAPNVYNDIDGRPRWLFDLYPEAKSNSNIRIFICRDLSKEPDGAFDSVEFSTVDHPLEPKKRQQLTEEQQDGAGNVTIIKKGPWGLNGRKCVKIKLPGIDLFCPVQCFGNNNIVKEGYRDLTKKENQDDFTRDVTGTFVDLGANDGFSGYRVFANASQSFNKILPKIKYLYLKSPKSLNVGKVDYSIKDLSSESNMAMLQRKACLISKGGFESLAQKYEKYSTVSQDKPLKKMNFKMAGAYPKEFSPKDGLVSVQITIGDDGVYTSYNFEDQIIKPPSDQVVEDYIKFLFEPKSVGGQKSLTTMGYKNYNVGINVSRNQGSLMYDPKQK